jgi:hypothetical protein
MKPALIAALAVPVLALGAWSLRPANPQAAPLPVAAKAVAPAPKPEIVPSQVELALALEQGTVTAEFAGNGKDRLRMALVNKGAAPLEVNVPLGQVFETDAASPVIVVQADSIVVQPGRQADTELRTAALRSTCPIQTGAYRLSYMAMPKLEALLQQVQRHPEINRNAVQTAVLAMTENLPLSAVAKFTLAGGTLPSRFNTDAFRVETHEIMGALVLLREIGAREAGIALTVNPQLKIEGMIDPATRPMAMRYYGIAPEQEWEFWRAELLQGQPSTRHYALYGIARFYPDVALQMLPRWARETRTNPVYRLSAVQALADTQRPEALAILRQLSAEMGMPAELASAAKGAAEYLDYQLAMVAQARNAVAFRTARKGPVQLASANVDGGE